MRNVREKEFLLNEKMGLRNLPILGAFLWTLRCGLDLEIVCNWGDIFVSDDSENS